MPQLTRILCPIDFSDFSRDALVHASGVADWYDARVTVLHAYATPRIPVAPVTVPGGVPILPSVEPHEMVERVREFCASTDRIRAARLDVVVTEGSPSREILRQAEMLGPDLIVMGTHGRGGFERLLLGSVTDKVLRRAAVPVLVVPPPAEPAGSGLYKTILCAMDFSDASVRALEYALSLAKEGDARLVLLHTVEDDEVVQAARFTEASHFSVPEYFDHRIADAASRLEAAVPEEARLWCHPETRIVSGRASREILRIAEEERTELIAIGVHGRGAVDRWLFGSTTDYVVRRATCPVLTLRT